MQARNNINYIYNTNQPTAANCRLCSIYFLFHPHLHTTNPPVRYGLSDFVKKISCRKKPVHARICGRWTIFPCSCLFSPLLAISRLAAPLLAISRLFSPSTVSQLAIFLASPCRLLLPLLASSRLFSPVQKSISVENRKSVENWRGQVSSRLAEVGAKTKSILQVSEMVS